MVKLVKSVKSQMEIEFDYRSLMCERLKQQHFIF